MAEHQDMSSREHTISKADLPLSCPLPSQTLWNAHPKVYLPIEKTGQATCPYCGTQYRLETLAQ